MQSLIDFFLKYAANGNEVAMRFRRGYRMETWSYERIAQGANRLARELEFRGIGPGGAVLLWGENSPEWIVAFFGCLLRGAMIVPVDHGSTRELVSRIARQVHRLTDGVRDDLRVAPARGTAYTAASYSTK